MYRIMLNELRMHVECNDGLQPWSTIYIAEPVQSWDQYRVRVCAVNDTGYGPRSEPPCNVLMNQNPPVHETYCKVYISSNQHFSVSAY